jgi:5'-nucleotidase
MSAAVEGALENIPSAGFSLLNHSIDADFSASKKIVRQVVEKMLKEKIPDNTCLNVNIPDIEYSLINGLKICRQAVANWEEDFDERIDPSGNKYYWLTGKFVNYDEGTDTDEWALANNYVSIVPIQYDLTNYAAIKKLKSWE